KEAVPADQEVKIAATTAPRWLEIPDLNGKLTRRLPLENVSELRQKFPKVYRLVVWEFEDDAGHREAIAVEHPQDGRVLVLEQEIPEWPFRLDEMIRNAKPSTP